MTLAQLRYQHGKLTQKQLATFLHVDRSAISKWESGKQAPDRNTAMRIAELFEVSFADIEKMFIKQKQPKTNILISQQTNMDEFLDCGGELCQKQ